MQKLILTEIEDKVLSCLIDSATDRTLEIHLDAKEPDGILKKGDILTARVERIDAGLGGCFMQTANGQNAYLDLKHTASAVFTGSKRSGDIKPGDELVVSVLRGQIKGKLPSVTCELSLAGRYCVVFNAIDSVCVTGKAGSADRVRLKDAGTGILQNIQKILPSAGILMRTGAAGLDDLSVCEQEAVALASSLSEILKKAPFRPAGTILYRMPPLWLSRIATGYAAFPEKIVTDSETLCNLMAQALKEHPEDQQKLQLHEDRMIGIESLYSLKTRISHALAKTVYLKSGGNLIIEPTQALVVIDVNSGKQRFRRDDPDREEVFLKLNREAADEAARQIRLRNMSGIILIDFINMKRPESFELLAGYLTERLKSDPVKTVFAGFTSLGLAQITREKKEPPLWELIS